MLKTKIFDFFASSSDVEFIQERRNHNLEISSFVENISKDGNTFVSIDSVGYGRNEVTNRIRTIIVYIENPTRTVLVEKDNTDGNK